MINLFSYLIVFAILYTIDTYQLYQAWGLNWYHTNNRIIQYQSDKYQSPAVQAFGQAADAVYNQQYPKMHTYYRAHNQYLQAYNRCNQHYNLDNINTNTLSNHQLAALTRAIIDVYQKRITEYQADINFVIWQIQQDQKLDHLGVQAAAVESQKYADLKADFLTFINQQTQLNQSLRPLHFRDQIFARHFANKFANPPLENYRGYTQQIWQATKAHQTGTYAKLIVLLHGYQQICTFLTNDLNTQIKPLPDHIQTWLHNHQPELEHFEATNQNTERDD